MAATVFEPASAYATAMELDSSSASSSSSTLGHDGKPATAFMNDLDFYNTNPPDLDSADRKALYTFARMAGEEVDMMEMAELMSYQHYYTDACYGFNNLPEDLVYLVFTFLHGSDLCNGVQKVCRSWRRLALDDQMWLDLLRRIQMDQKDEEDLKKPDHKSWKWLYQSRHLIINDVANIGSRVVVGRHETADYVYEGDWKDGKHHGTGRKMWKNIKPESEARQEEGDAHALAEEEAAVAEAASSNQQQSLPKRGAQPKRKPVLPYYEGEWKEGKEHGKGKRLFEEDHYYIGEWKEGDREGYGFYHWPNKTYYEGEFKEGFRHGHGTYTWSEKAKYIGQWQKGIEHGKGVRTWADGDRYEGDWVHGTRTGNGLYAWPNGSSYEGKWLQCAHEGYGVYKWPDGRTYKGNFSANKKHGFGEYFWPDGAMFSGNWRNGVRHGENGTMVWPDGSRFVGEWTFDRRGDGRYFSIDGREVPQSVGASWAKKYDYYFAMPMDMWEQMYLPEINKLIRERKQREQEEEEARRMNLEFTQKGKEDPRAWGVRAVRS
jgi:hypothetical protein